MNGFKKKCGEGNYVVCCWHTCHRPAQSVYALLSAEAQRVSFGWGECTEWN